MSKDSVLKKQFQEKDVQRLRNLMTGKYGDKTIKSVGYRKAQVIFIMKEIYGKKMVELGLLKMELNKTLLN